MSFHVPVWGRNTDHPQLGSSDADGNNGAFDVQSPEPGWTLTLIASDGDAWEHVSVHAWRNRGAPPKPWRAQGRQLRTPTWKEMAFVKDLCWDPEDVVMQLHPRRSEYVNTHAHVLHLWRPIGVDIPTPPKGFV